MKSKTITQSMLSILIPVSRSHWVGMQLAAMASTRGGGSADRWAMLTLSAGRVPKPAGPCSFSERPTGYAVIVTLPRESFDQLATRASRHGLTLRQWMHAVLVAASAKYRATIERQEREIVVAVSPRLGGARITLACDPALSERIEILAMTTRNTIREVIALAVYQDKSASQRIGITYHSRAGHSFTMELGRGQLAALNTRARNAGLPVPEFLRRLLREAPEAEPAPCQSLPENVLPFFTGHFRQA